MEQHQDILYRSFKVQLYPTEEQKIMIQKHFDARRFIWNHYLGKIKDSMNSDNGYIGNYKNETDLTQLKKQEEYTWLNEVDRDSLDLTLKDLDESFQRFFKNQCQFPKFKTKKKPENSYTTRIDKRKSKKDKITSTHIQLPKIGLVKRSKTRENVLQLLSNKDRILVTISKSNTDKYYCSILVPIEKEQQWSNNKHELLDWDNAVGIDVGIKHLATLSDGTVYEPYKTDKHNENRIKKLQQALSRKTSGSTKYKETCKRLAKAKSKVNNQRKAYISNIAVKIVKKYDYIYTEDISINEWYTNYSKINKAIDEANVRTFLTVLQDKSQAYGKVCYSIDRYYPSTKTCNVCGYVNDSLTLDDREWICPICDTKHNRDVNAAINILNRGKELYGADLLLDYVDMVA